MKKRLLFILALSLIALNSVNAQTKRTVTNEDLEKYRQKRVAAERDLRENYERLGFPSPAEMERQIEQSRLERSELAARLQAENLERERLNIERQRAANEAQILSNQTMNENSSVNRNGYFYENSTGGFYGTTILGYPNYRSNRGNFGRNNRRAYRNQPRVEYRNNLPVIVQPPPRRILAPRQTNGRRN